MPEDLGRVDLGPRYALVSGVHSSKGPQSAIASVLLGHFGVDSDSGVVGGFNDVLTPCMQNGKQREERVCFR